MGDKLRFDGRVVIVTGAGAGLGKAYAVLFAERGAMVVVNDLGGSQHGDGKSSMAADKVVDEIKSKGGKAVADYNSVVDGDKVVQTALENFGRVDIIVNNAGILRDKSFARISSADWDMIHDVHLKGSYKTTQAAWPHFRKQNYGRIIMTSSGSGLYGNFGQANYSAAKMGLIGLCNTLAIEGQKYNIHCNVIVPTAASRLTENILPPDLFAELKPELIAPVVAWLCHEECSDNGSVIESSAGWASKYFLMRGKGSLLRKKITSSVSIEDVSKQWEEVTSNSSLQQLGSLQEATTTLMSCLEQLRESDNTSGAQVSGTEFSFNDRDSIIYSLGIGATLTNPGDLKYLYEGHENFCAFPTFAIIPGVMATMSSDLTTKALPKSYDLSQVLHGEQYLELYQPMPTSGLLTNEISIADVVDKGKNALIICDVHTFDENKNKICFGQMTIFIVGGGGFGGKRNSDKAIEPKNPPNRPADSVVMQATSKDQTALYRLSGDLNPLHISPDFAAVSGFSKPILHGLCSLGFSARHILEEYGQNNPSLFKAIKVRFSKPVYPGETLKTEMWRENKRIYFRTSVVESGSVAITGGYVDLHEVQSRPSLKAVANSDLSSDAVFAAIEERVNANKKNLIKKINGTFVYNITKNGATVATWTLDLKNGKVYRNSPESGVKVDTTLTVDDQVMLDIALGKLNPQAAFMKGKLKIKGNLMLTQKLKELMSTESKL